MKAHQITAALQDYRGTHSAQSMIQAAIPTGKITRIAATAALCAAAAFGVTSADQTAYASELQNANGKTYYVADNGSKLTGQQHINGAWYYFDTTTGEMATGFVYIPDQDKWVFYGSDGVMDYGEQHIDGGWYYLDPHTGAVDRDFTYIPDKDKWVHYDTVSGRMDYNQQHIDGGWYMLDGATGAVNYGFVYIPDQDKWVFYDRVTGRMLYGEQNIDGNWYNFDSTTGAVLYGWQKLADGRTVYYDTVTGIMVHGETTINGVKVKFDSITGAADSNGVKLSQGVDPNTLKSNWTGSVLTKSAGVNYGPSGKETYYNLDMSTIVSMAKSAGVSGEYWVRSDGAKMLGDYIMVAANLSVHPRYTTVETSMGTGIVVDTGGFAASNANQIDIATNW